MDISMPSPQLPEQLPPLKKDISIQEGGLDFNGEPTWVIQDLSNNHFFHIGWREYQLFSRWDAVSPQDLITHINTTISINVTEKEMMNFLIFLSQNYLIEQSYEFIANKHKEFIYKDKQTHWFIHLAKKYLFFRIPLVNPNGLLNKLYPSFAFLFKRPFFIFIFSLFITTLVSLSTVWSQYSTTFFQLNGGSFFLYYFLALSIAKIFHEFGHAFACKHHRLNVSSMGIAFLVMFPMLYTDTNESWKIRAAKDRIKVALAGVWVEFLLAIAAFWIWRYTPAGTLHSLCYFLSSYSLLTTLLINISPFLRFDGYHMLSDLLSMRNLQTRAFALTRWWLREKLFALQHEPPEFFGLTKQRILIIYSICTWLYRFILFLGIAILVYYLFFKVLGLILFIIEIFYFVLMPILYELKQWWQMRQQIKFNTALLKTLTLIIAFNLILFTPWKSTINIPATLTQKHIILFSSSAAEVKEVFVKNGDTVHKDQILVKLMSSEIEKNLKKLTIQIQKLQWKLRDVATFSGKLGEAKSIKTEIHKLKLKRNYLLTEKQSLIIRAPMSGKITHLGKTLLSGTWVAKNQALLMIASSHTLVVKALANINQLSLIKKNQQASFIPPHLDQEKIALTISKISNGSVTELSDHMNNKNFKYLNTQPNTNIYHASNYGGDISVRGSSFEVEENLYQILLKPTIS